MSFFVISVSVITFFFKDDFKIHKAWYTKEEGKGELC